MDDRLDRYQNQPWYIKLWRRRWYMVIPVWALRQLLNKKCKASWYTNDWHPYSFKDWFFMCWGLSESNAQIKMNWCYDLEEIINMKMSKKG